MSLVTIKTNGEFTQILELIYMYIKLKTKKDTHFYHTLSKKIGQMVGLLKCQIKMLITPYMGRAEQLD